MVMHSYKDLVVWQKAMDLVVAIYDLTDSFPKEQMYGLTSQMRRAGISIPANIAEGRFRGTKKAYLQFLRIAYSSGAELETQLEIAKRLKRTQRADYSVADSLLLEVMKMLNKLLRSLNPKT